MDDKPFMSIDDIESYGEKSVSPVLYLILESLGEVSDSVFDMIVDS